MISESLIRKLTFMEWSQVFSLSWTRPGENPPVGLILCSEKDHAVARYALAGLDNKILSAEYRLALPPEKP